MEEADQVLEKKKNTHWKGKSPSKGGNLHSAPVTAGPVLPKFPFSKDKPKKWEIWIYI